MVKIREALEQLERSKALKVIDVESHGWINNEEELTRFRNHT